MVRRVELLAAKPEDISSIPRLHMAQPLQTVLSTGMQHTGAPTQIKCNTFLKKEHIFIARKQKNKMHFMDPIKTAMERSCLKRP